MSDRMLVATRKGLFDFQRHGSSWDIADASFVGDNCSMTLRDPRDGALYAALDHGHFGCKLHRSDDEGRTWREIAAPAYAEGDFVYPSPMKQETDNKPASLELIWILEPGGDDQPNRIWAGTIPGGLFRSDDRGASWQMVRSLWDRDERREWFGGGFDNAGLHSIIIHPDDSRHITVGLSCGGVWQSTDDGESWTQLGHGLHAAYMPPERAGDLNIQDPHRIVACRADHNVMWIQHHNGIFRSADGARNWTQMNDVEPSDFGFGVAVHPHDPDTAWFAPGIKDEKRIPVDGKFVVTRTRDGGQTFEQLTAGLPQQHAYHLVFRHALEVDETGERLAMGSTTGSLFTSDDAGDSWQHVTAHLPPVYAVRFV